MEVETPEKEVEYKASVGEDGKVILKKKEKISKGKKGKTFGALFEMRVRHDLEEKGWVACKWSNNVDLEEKRIVPAKKNWKFNPHRKIMMPSAQGTGFPDFICYQEMEKGRYNIIGVEVKTNGILSREEKMKCKFLLEKNIFSEILVAKKIKKKNRILVEYINFKKILERMR